MNISAFVDHGTLGNPRMSFAADAWVDEEEPHETMVYTIADEEEEPVGEWDLVTGPQDVEQRMTRPLEYYTDGFNGEFNALPAADENGDGHCNYPYTLTANRNAVSYYQALGYTSQMSESSVWQGRLFTAAAGKWVVRAIAELIRQLRRRGLDDDPPGADLLKELFDEARRPTQTSDPQGERVCCCPTSLEFWVEPYHHKGEDKHFQYANFMLTYDTVPVQVDGGVGHYPCELSISMPSSEVQGEEWADREPHPYPWRKTEEVGTRFDGGDPRESPGWHGATCMAMALT